MSHYSPDYYDVYREAQATHWWFRGREAVLQALIPHDAMTSEDAVFDIGCGPGGPTPAVFAGRAITAIDLDVSVLQAYTRATDRVTADVSSLPFHPRSVRILCAFDILEHLQDDVGALRNWYEVLAPGAWLIITVPAYEALWSSHDEVNGHHRRYRASQLHERLRKTGFSVVRVTYFNTLLLPPIALLRWWGRLTGGGARGNANGGRDLDFSCRLPGPIERCFEGLFHIERHWLKRWSLPAGVSIFAVAQRPLEGAETGIGDGSEGKGA